MVVEQMLNNAPKTLLHIADVSGSALFQGDCLYIMPLIPDKSVQLILADLPYGTTACKWDSIIDLDLLWKQYKRIIKDNGAIVLTASQPFTTKLISSNLDWFRYEWIWVKNRVTNIFNAKKQPMKSHENICVFYKQQSIYNPIFEDRLLNSHNRKNTKTRNTTQIYGNSQMIIKELEDKSYPKSVQFINSVHPHSKEYLGHGTQKPLGLMKYLISTYTNDGDLVLDNTMGSGTTCLAAKELNRKFIGIEKEPKYYEIACKRCGF